MSVAKLGSYADLLVNLHRFATRMVAPVAPVTPVAARPAAAPLGRDTFVTSLRPDPNSFFISQIRDTRWNPEANQGNTNCGPTSLAMALKALGVTPPGLTNPYSAEMWIDKTRRAMEGDENDYKLTSDDDVVRGALASGASATKVHDLGGVEQALQQGQYVVLAGNPVGYGGRMSASQYQAFNGGHFILVTGKQGDRFTISDPLSRVGSLSVTRAELAAYMAYQDWNTGVAVGRR